MYEVQERFSHCLKRQVNEYYAAKAAQKLSMPHNFRAIPIFKHLIGYVSRYALRMIEEQRDLAAKMIEKRQLPTGRGI